MWREAITIGLTYAGTVVGAGFASGQEILRFFVVYDTFGRWGLLGATVLLGLGGWLLMRAGYRLRSASYRDALIWMGGPAWGRALDLTLSLFLFASLAVMTAGAGAVAQQQWGRPAAEGAALLALAATLVTWRGLPGIHAANRIIVPLLVLCVTAAGILAEHNVPPPSGQAGSSLSVAGAAAEWWLAALLYPAYNVALSIGVLVPLGHSAKQPRSLAWGAALGAALLGGLAFTIANALDRTGILAWQAPIPLLVAAASAPDWLRHLFAAALWAEIFSTAVASLFGAATRLTEALPVSRGTAAAAAALAGWLAAGCGFPQLVSTLYPLFGYISLGLFATLILSIPRTRR